MARLGNPAALGGAVVEGGFAEWSNPAHQVLLNSEVFVIQSNLPEERASRLALVITG